MKEPFDPFDPKHRDRKKRRRSVDVVAEKKAWDNKIDKAVREAIEDLSDSRYVTSREIFAKAGPAFDTNWEVVRRNLEASMARIGYLKMVNSRAKDGRFKVDGASTFVYRRKDQSIMEFHELKQYFA